MTRLFVARPTLVFVLVSVMVFAGILSTVTIVRQLFPNVSQPTVSINVVYNGASVTEMRDNIVAPIEENLAGSTDLQFFNSVIQQGKATISATYTLDSDTATDLALTQKAVQASESQLPTNLSPPTVSIRDPSETTVVTLGLFSSKLPMGQLSLFAQNVIAPQLEQVPGVSYANVAGVVTPAYEVEVDPNLLAANGLTLNDLINTLSTDNTRVPGGFIYEPNRQTTVDVRGDIRTPSDVRNLAIQASGTASTSAPTGDAGAVSSNSNGLAGLPGTVNTWTASNSIRRIGDVAKVIPGFEPRTQYAQIDGRPGLFLQIQKASNASEVTASDNVIAQLPLLRKQFPDITFKTINVQSKFTQQQIASVTRTLAEAIFLTGLAMMFFLRSWRSALVVCVSIPTSLAIAISAMRLFNFTLDTISLLGMSLVIGILVDDSTVVLENIERHFRELRAPPAQAAIEGREEIGAAAVVITLVDVVVFLPIAFMGGQVGHNLVEFAMVVVISTLTSLFVSFTVTPTLAGLWALKSHWKPPRIVEAFGDGFDRIRSTYAHRILPWALRNGALVAGACLASFVGALLLVPLGFIGEEFVPATDRGQLYIQATYPIGTPVTTVRDGIFAVERKIDGTPDVFSEVTTGGAYSAAFGGFVTQSNVGQMTIFLKDDRKHSSYYWMGKFRALARNMMPQASVNVVESTGTTGGNQQPIDLLVSDVTGGDPTKYAAEVLGLLQRTPGAISVNSNGVSLAPQVSIEFDRAKAQALDVDLGAAATAAGAAFGGNVATQFETPQGLEQVQVIYPLSAQHELEALNNVPIRANDGSIVHLGDIASFKLTPAPPLVTQTNRDTVIHVDANMAPGYSLSGVQNAFFKRLRSLHLPSYISVKPAPLGQQDLMQQTLAGMGHSMILSVILVFLLMVALYNSYRSPFIILFSVPVAAVGALGALLVTGRTLNIFSLIGTILLIGISSKNGILLVDYANTLRARGRSKTAAIMESAFTRFRPIVMTSFSVLVGNIPLAIAFEPGSATRSSLGIVIIGGVLSSLVLTLLLVPNAYLWLAPRDAPRSAPPRDGVSEHPALPAREPVGASA